MSRSERECENSFLRMGKVYNANTPENHPISFKTESDYMTAMSVLAVCIGMHPEVKLYAFQLMSNHIHLVTSGPVSVIRSFFDYFVNRIRKVLGNSVDLSGFTLKLFPVSDLYYLRNAIAYVNRNGFIVNNDVTPFSYPWGSSQYFFQPSARRYHETCGRAIGVATLRELMHSRACDHLKDLKFIDGYISPLEFCHIEEAENIFRDAKQYFYIVARNIESSSEIAKSIGESIYYTDTDLYIAASKMAKELYGDHNPKILPPEAKLDMAKRLHFDYNAGDKQLNRILGIDLSILKSLF